MGQMDSIRTTGSMEVVRAEERLRIDQSKQAAALMRVGGGLAGAGLEASAVAATSYSLCEGMGRSRLESLLSVLTFTTQVRAQVMVHMHEGPDNNFWGLVVLPL